VLVINTNIVLNTEINSRLVELVDWCSFDASSPQRVTIRREASDGGAEGPTDKDKALVGGRFAAIIEEIGEGGSSAFCVGVRVFQKSV
jgi:hypothetical protein